MENLWELSEPDRETLERLAETFIPRDETNDGLYDMGFSGIIEMRNKYQPELAHIYADGIQCVNEISRSRFEKFFCELTPHERDQVIELLMSGDRLEESWTDCDRASIFFENLKMDACFVYGTSEEVWEQIGFSGPSFEAGGFPDYDKPQE